MAEWRNPKPTVDGVVPWEGGVVLVRRAREPFRGMWALPGGFVDYGEPPERAVVREVKEETGLEVRVARLVGVYGSPDRDPRGHTIGIVYECEAVGGELRGGDDAAEARAWPPDGLPELAFDHGRVLADWKGPRRVR